MEQSKTVVLPVTLKGSNYIVWSRLTKNALGGRGLWSHITSSEAPKQTSQGEDGKELVVVDEDKWSQEDLMVLSILQSSLDTPLMESYSHCTTAKQLWDTLQRVYGNTSNLSRVYEVKKAISCLNQEDMDFNRHFGKFSALWSELEMLRPHTADPAALEERREQDKVFALLLTLNSNYGDLIKHILRAEKLPTLDDVCNQIQKEMGSVGLFSGKGDLNMAHQAEAASANKVFAKQDNRRPFCGHCKKEGHMKNQCWILHPHLRPPSRFSQARSHEAAQHAGQQGNQLMRPAGDGRAMISTNHVGGSGSSQAAPEDAFIRKSDIEALIKALNANSGNTRNNFLNISPSAKPLIIDSGASHHMIKILILLVMLNLS